MIYIIQLPTNRSKTIRKHRFEAFPVSKKREETVHGQWEQIVQVGINQCFVTVFEVSREHIIVKLTIQRFKFHIEYVRTYNSPLITLLLFLKRRYFYSYSTLLVMKRIEKVDTWSTWKTNLIEKGIFYIIRKSNNS